MREQPQAAPDHFCLKCRYVLNHLDQPRCPECGRVFDPANPATYAKTPYRLRHWPVVVTWLTAVVPLWLLLSFYVSWARTWMHLGHPPQVYVDDVYPPYSDSGVTFALMLDGVGRVPSLCGLMATSAYVLYRKRFRVALALLGVVLLWALPLLMIAWDPFDAWTWFFD